MSTRVLRLIGTRSTAFARCGCSYARPSPGTGATSLLLQSLPRCQLYSTAASDDPSIGISSSSASSKRKSGSRWNSVDTDGSASSSSSSSSSSASASPKVVPFDANNSWIQADDEERRAVIVRKVSLLEEVERGLVPARLDSLSDLQRHAHTENLRAIEQVQRALHKKKFHVNTVEELTHRDVDWASLVVTVGGDGTFLRASHFFSDGNPTLIVGVNSSPSSSYGFFCAATRTTFMNLLSDILARKQVLTPLWRMKVLVNNKAIQNPILNDCLFAANTPVTTVRYNLHYQGKSQLQKSSGVWVCTSAGSTAALRSAGGDVMDLSDTRMQFRIRELFMSSVVGSPIKAGYFTNDYEFVIESRLPSGRLYLDGHHEYMTVTFGDRIQFRTCTHPLRWIRPQASPDYWDPRRWRGQWQTPNVTE